MSELLYRYRNIAALTDQYNELEKQEIFFCSPIELNDPLEGFKDVFWQGDSIVWRNLLRHYLLCLLQITLQAATQGEEFSGSILNDVVHQIPDHLLTTKSETFTHPSRNASSATNR